MIAVGSDCRTAVQETHTGISNRINLRSTTQRDHLPNLQNISIPPSENDPMMSCLTIAATLLFPGVLTDRPSTGLAARKTPDGYEVFENDTFVMRFQTKAKSLDGRFQRSNYVHPLCDLHGDTITEDFPADHLHHRGIFWAWHQLRVGQQQIGDPWLCRDFATIVHDSAAKRVEGKIQITNQVHWQSPKFTDEQGLPVTIVKEQTRVTVHPRTDTFRIVEFEISLTANLNRVSIGGSNDTKGYGGFSPRLKLSPEHQFVSGDRILTPAKNAIQAGPWVDVTTERSGVAIFTHPENPGAPEPWILRARRSMQNARNPGRWLRSLSRCRPMVLRYQLVIHNGPTDSSTLSSLYQQFASRHIHDAVSID